MSLLTKPDVKFDVIAPAGFKILWALQTISERMTRDLTITCGSDSHPEHDPHSRGLAFDVRTADLSQAQILTLVTGLRGLLGPSFTVLYETAVEPAGVLSQIAYVNPGASAPHVHCQLRKGLTSWP